MALETLLHPLAVCCILTQLSSILHTHAVFMSADNVGKVCDPTPELQLIPRRSTQGSGSHAAPSKCTRKGNKNCHMMNEESFTDLAQRKRKRIKNEPIVCVCIAYQKGLMQKGQIELCLQTMESISCCLHDHNLFFLLTESPPAVGIAPQFSPMHTKGRTMMH